MELFVGNIARTTSVLDLKRLFKGFDKKAVFEVKRMKGKQGKFAFGIVTFQSERLAKKAIKKLHLKKLNGKPVIVREYLHRAGGNERRQLGWRNKLWLGEERRQAERRDAQEHSQAKDNFNSYAA